MPENNDTNAGASQSPTPIFVSFIYDFVKTETHLAGDPGGKPGTLGGPIGGQEPKFKVFTYQFMPMPAENIAKT